MKKASAQTTSEILDLVASGSYGTYDNPIRSSSPKAVFWAVAKGQRKASEYKNAITYPFAVAGEAYRERR